ncbi:MAG: TRAP transporter small permease [Kiritimatiellae bacterium]|nr:TRAP transporter small permease [Kiritimatiellia bacterium]
MSAPDKKKLGWFWGGVVVFCHVMTGLACLGIAVSILVVCADVVLRVAGHPVKGAYDIVRITGAITIACALPLTTAVKGHVAIEYFFRKLNRVSRLVVDSLMRMVMICCLILASYECVGYGTRFLRNRQVTDTIEIPIFWVPWLMAAAFFLTAVIVVFHLVYPGREIIRS